MIPNQTTTGDQAAQQIETNTSPDSGAGATQPSSRDGLPPNSVGTEGAGTQPPAPTLIPEEQPPAPPQLGEHKPEEPSLASRMYHGILSALGGANDVSVSRNPDGSLNVSKTASGPGTQWKRIIAGALQGAGAAAQNARPGPGGITRALGAGINSTINNAQQENDAKRQEATETYNLQQQAITRKAQQALLTQQLTANSFELERRKVDAAYADATHSNDFMNFVHDNGGTDLGTARNLDEVIAMHKNDPNLLKQLPQGRIIAMPDVDAAGKITGTLFALVPPSWETQRIDQDMQLPYLKPSDKKDGKPTVAFQTIPAGTMSRGKYAAFYTNQMNEILKQELNESEETFRDRTGKATAAKDYAQANEANAHAAQIPKLTEIAQQNADTKGNSATTKQVTQHNKDYVKPAEDTDTSYRLADDVYKQYKALKAKGQEFPSGAQSMLMLSQHLGTTFGGVKGARLSKDLIQEHLGARSISDAAQVALQRLTNGDSLSSSQWDAFHDLISEARRQKWTTAVKEAKRAHVPVDFLPDDLQDVDAPANATATVHDPNTNAVTGYIVDGKFKPIGAK